jgi:hypothetical protein
MGKEIKVTRQFLIHSFTNLLKAIENYQDEHFTGFVIWVQKKYTQRKRCWQLKSKPLKLAQIHVLYDTHGHPLTNAEAGKLESYEIMKPVEHLLDECAESPDQEHYMIDRKDFIHLCKYG